MVEVAYIGIEHALELLLLKDQQVIEAFLSDAPHEAFADGIGAFRMIRRFQYLDAAGCGHARERLLPLDMVDKSIGPFQADFGPVFLS